MAASDHKGKIAGGGIAIVTTGLIAFISQYEGTRYKPYYDDVGVLTVCEGITGKHVIRGKEYTRKECDALLAGEIEKHGSALMKCVSRPITQNQYEALASWTYNVGVGAACKSTLVRQINEGKPATVWCDGLLAWNKAGGITFKGLVRRREAERELCLKDA